MKHIKYLFGYDGDPLAFKGDVERNLLSIAVIHHMRREGANKLSGKVKADWPTTKVLISKDQLKKRILG